MRIIGISDIHGRTNYNRDVAHALGSGEFIIISGDITNFGGKEVAFKVLNELIKINRQVFAVFGNCDQDEVLQVIKALDINIHNEVKLFGNTTIFGIGGSGWTPFNTPQEFSDGEIKRILDSYQKLRGFKIFVSHSPPFNTKVDKTLMGVHAGNKVIREFIERHQPDLCICGHIHEARGIDKIGKTIIVNPGPFPKYYALIEINDKIDVQLS